MRIVLLRMPRGLPMKQMKMTAGDILREMGIWELCEARRIDKIDAAGDEGGKRGFGVRGGELAQQGYVVIRMHSSIYA